MVKEQFSNKVIVPLVSCLSQLHIHETFIIIVLLNIMAHIFVNFEENNALCENSKLLMKDT